MHLLNQHELRAFCGRAQTSDIVAVDTEFIREKTYYPHLCLLQLATAGEVALVDPFAVRDLSCVTALFENKAITKVFHACPQDLEVIYHALGCETRPVFDTQIAAEFLGAHSQLAYGALVKNYTGVTLDKAETLSDWSRRPLDDAQLRYAADDVAYLPGIYHEMISRLEKLGRLSWIEPEMEAIQRTIRMNNDPSRAYLHLRRSGGLTRRQLALVRELACWREKCAAYRDIPRKWILRDEVIVEIGKRHPHTASELRRIRGAAQLNDDDVAGILAAVVAGESVSEDQLPVTHKRSKPAPETESVIDLMYALLRIIANESGIATTLIANRDDLTEFAVGSQDTRLLESWRYELAGKRLKRLLAGDIGLTVKEGRVEQL